MRFDAQLKNNVTEKLAAADRLLLSPRSVTMKDENGKTCGVIRNMERFSDMPARRSIEVWPKIKNLTILKRDRLYQVNGDLYYFNNISLENLIEESKNPFVFTDDIKKVVAKNEDLKLAENAGIFIVNYR